MLLRMWERPAYAGARSGQPVRRPSLRPRRRGSGPRSGWFAGAPVFVDAVGAISCANGGEKGCAGGRSAGECRLLGALGGSGRASCRFSTSITPRWKFCTQKGCAGRMPSLLGALGASRRASCRFSTSMAPRWKFCTQKAPSAPLPHHSRASM